MDLEDGSSMISGPMPGAPTDPEAPNRYSVHVHQGDRGWEVRIAAPEGIVAWSRVCSGEVEARTLASTIQQHIYWLSPGKFREYYRLEEQD